MTRQSSMGRRPGGSAVVSSPPVAVPPQDAPRIETGAVDAETLPDHGD